jgi:ABC-type transport system substrate-binding protein
MVPVGTVPPRGIGRSPAGRYCAVGVPRACAAQCGSRFSRELLLVKRAAPADAYSDEPARERLQQDGFRWQNGQLYDSSGYRVEFSLITNAGNKARARIAALVQQDLEKIGIKLNVVPLEFASLIERITRTFAYDVCLLARVNVDLDPNSMMNVWLSTSADCGRERAIHLSR